MTLIPNHYGYGLRNDEKPFAHKIPPGGYWYDLPPEDIAVFWNGKIPTKGESSNGLRRMSWDEPSWTIRAGTITGQPWHPSRYEVSNHNPQPLSEKALEYLHRDPRHLQKHRPPTVDEPSPTLPAVLHKGVPYGLFYPPNHDPGSFWTPKSEYTYDQANRVQSMDAPCNTIPAHHNSGQPIHPTQAPRRFTVRECLRIQSVPDWYVLPDDISLSAQYRIVGNGVASRVAYLLGIALAEQLRAATESSVIGERLRTEVSA